MFIVKKLDDGFHLFEDDAIVNETPCKIIEDGRTIVLPKNETNRMFISVKKVEEAGEDGVELTFKDPALKRTYNSADYLPNRELVKYMSEEEAAEYKAIIARAIEARKAASTSVPKDTRAKLEAKLAKLQAELAALNAED